MAAMVESDPAPSLLEPTTKVGDDTAVPSTEASIANASHAISKENQDLDLVDTRLLMTDGAASLPQVTKLPTEHLVDIVESVVSDAKKFEDTNDPAIILDVKGSTKPVVEETAAIHSKDITAVSNVSEAATLVATYDVEDTLKEDAGGDTKPGVVSASPPEEVPNSNLVLVAAVQPHSQTATSSKAAAEVNPSAQEEFIPTAESIFGAYLKDANASEPRVGSVAEVDPVVSTRVAIEAPVAEQEAIGKLSEDLLPKEEEITEHHNPTPAEESVPTADTQVIPAVEEATGADNEDAKKEAEDVELTEAEVTQMVEDKAAESEAQEAVAEIKAKANEEQNVEVQPQEVSVQIDEAPPTPMLGEAVEAPNASSLNAEEIAVEIVAPTPALVDQRQLTESEDIQATEELHEEGTSTPIASEEVVTEGTETPRAEPAEEAVQNPTIESIVADQQEKVEESITQDVQEVPAVVEIPVSVDEHSHVVEGPASEATTETVENEHGAAVKSQPQDKETKAEASPITEDVPVKDESPTNGTPAVTDAEIINNTPAVTSDESSAQEEAVAVSSPAAEPSIKSAAPQAEVVVHPEVSATEETPIADQTVEAVIVDERATSTWETTAPVEPSSESSAEIPPVDKEPGVTVDTFVAKEEDQGAAEGAISIEEATVEGPQTQEISAQKDSVAEKVHAQEVLAEETATVEPLVEETALVEEVPEKEEAAQTTVVEAPVATQTLANEKPTRVVDEAPAVEELIPAKEEVVEEPVVEHNPVEREALVEDIIAKELDQVPVASVESVEASAEDITDAAAPVSISQEDISTEEPAADEHALVEASVNKEEESMEKTPVTVPEAVTVVEESKAEGPAKISVPAEESAVDEQLVKEAAIQGVEQSIIEEGIDKESAVGASKEPIAEDERPAVEVVQKAEETTMDNATLAVAESTAKTVDGPVVEAAVGPTPPIAEATETASNELQAPDTITSFQEPTVQDAALVKAPIVEPSVLLTIPSTETVVDSVSPEEPLTQQVETTTVAGAGVTSANVEGTIVDIYAEFAAEDPGKAQVAVEDVPAKDLSSTLAAAVEPITEYSLDESISTSEMEEADTTTETIMVPEPIIEKKEFVAPVVEDVTIAHDIEVPALAPEKLTLNIPEEPVQIERPKSPWTPSFHVTTIGHGVSLPEEEDIPSQDLDTTEVTKDIQPAHPEIVVEDKSVEDSTEEVQPATEVAEPETASLSWTPSYSVHSQGSPSPTHASLEPEIPILVEVVPSIQEDTPATEDRTFSTTDKDSEPPKTAATVEPEVAQIAEPGSDPKEVEVQVVKASEPLHDEKDTEIPVVVHAVGEPGVEAENQVHEQPQDTAEPEPAPEEFQKSLIVDTSTLTHPSEHERTASLAWVTSYSVRQQGSSLPPQVSLPSVAAESTERDLAPAPVVAQEPEVVKVQEISVDIGSAPPTVVVDDSQAEEPQEEQITKDRPMTPWTPSYSITRQGADVIDEMQIESLAPLDQTADEIVPERQPRRSLSEELEASGAFTPTALIGAGVAGGAAALAASAVFRKSAEPQNGTDSNDKQAFPDNGDIALSEAHQEKSFPTVEIPEENSKYNTVSLPPLDENSTLDLSTSLSPDTSPISPRKRLGSTTSSRLFPGGWFSNTSKIPDERTSLEVAQGVFAGTKQGATVEDTLVSPVVDPITPVREHSSSDKRKWCVIM